MSRYEAIASDGRTVVVGWDPPTATYFGQVLEPEPEGPCRNPHCELLAPLGKHDLRDCQDNQPELWVGFGAAMDDEIATVDELAERLDLAAYRAVVDQHRTLLEADRTTQPEPTERPPGIQALLDNLAGGKP